MGGYNGFDVIDMTLNKSDDPKEKDRVIRLLKAKTRMLEAAIEKEKAIQYLKDCEDDYVTYERALMQGIDLKEDIKLFENYRSKGSCVKVDDVIPMFADAAKNAKDSIQSTSMWDQLFGLKADENGELVTIEEKDVIIATKDLSMDGYEILDTTPTKVTLGGDKKEGLPLVGTNEVHSIVFEPNGPDEIDIKVNKQDCDITFPKDSETETHVVIRIKKRG